MKIEAIKKDNKRRTILIVLAILILILVFIGVTYSYYAAKVKFVNKSQTIIKTNEVSLVYTGVKEITTGSSMIPGDSFTKTFTVENTSKTKTTYNIYMEEITNEFNEDLVFVLSDDNGEVVAETPLPATNTGKSYLLKDIEIDGGELQSYTLKIEFKYLNTPQNDYQGKNFKATVGIDANQIPGGKMTLTETILKNNEIVQETPDLTYNAFESIFDYTLYRNTDTSGLYASSETNSGNNTYYFRNEVENNNVRFAGLDWQIIRINEDGSVRLILKNAIDNNKAYKFTDEIVSVDDMYYTNSTLKGELEDWYKNNLATYDNQIVEQVFCEQSKVIGGSHLQTNALEKLYDKYDSDFKCENDLNGYGIVKSKIGLINYDELLHAGAYVNRASNFYLKDQALIDAKNSVDMWTMSPEGFGTDYGTSAFVWSYQFYGQGIFMGTFVTTDRPIVKPVINLDSTVIVLDGDGYSGTPYVIG